MGIIALVLVVGVLLVATCLWQRHQTRSPVTDRARPGVPAVHWPDGRGTGRWDDDVWIQTLREAMTLAAVAVNARDFSDPALRDIMSDEVLESYVWSARVMAPADYHPGPQPFVVLDLESSAASAVVSACHAGRWSIADPDYVPTPESFMTGRGYRHVWELALRADGTRYVTSLTRVGPPGDLCPNAGTVVGYFDPPPPYGEFRDVVIGPDGRPSGSPTGLLEVSPLASAGPERADALLVRHDGVLGRPGTHPLWAVQRPKSSNAATRAS